MLEYIDRHCTVLEYVHIYYAISNMLCWNTLIDVLEYISSH